jgi:hypothetical protein
MRKQGKRMMSVIAGIAAVCVMTGGIGYQAIASGAQTNSTEQNEKGQDTDQTALFRKMVQHRSVQQARCRNLR